jgi:hypothetical protein
MQVEWKWCDGFSRDNLKHKLYTIHNLWKEAPLPSYNILCVSPNGLHSNVTFPLDSQMSQNFGRSYLSKIMYVLKMQGQYLIELEKIFLMVYKMPKLDFIWPLLLRDLWSGVEFPIWFLPLLLIITHANYV